MSYQVIAYRTDRRTATITLNGPDEVNTIVPPMLDELAHAVERATRDDDVKVIVLQGAGARSRRPPGGKPSRRRLGRSADLRFVPSRRPPTASRSAR